MMSKIKREQESGRVIWILVFVAVSIFILIFFAAKGKFTVPIHNQTVITLLAPFQRAATWAGNGIHDGLAEIWDILTVQKQNKMLRNEVEQLRAQNVKANEYAAENMRLRELLGYKNSATQFDLVVARVIGRESATWTRMIVIDRGTQDGVDKNMAVVTARGLVGVVTEAGPMSAKVEMILDTRTSVGALVQRSRVAGIIEGSPDNSRQPRLVNIPRNEDVQEGDVIVTSGFGGVYPKGLMIGKVESVHNDSGGLLKYAVVEPAVDFQRLEDVAVIVASREAPPEPLLPPKQTPGTETPVQEQPEPQVQTAVPSEPNSVSAPAANPQAGNSAANAVPNNNTQAESNGKNSTAGRGTK
ncbi:rod shape-determining protein MreC [Schwartzia sp. (in: firmicutes)]